MTEHIRKIKERRQHVGQKFTEDCPRGGDECACCAECANATLAQAQTVGHDLILDAAMDTADETIKLSGRSLCDRELN